MITYIVLFDHEWTAFVAVRNPRSHSVETSFRLATFPVLIWVSGLKRVSGKIAGRQWSIPVRQRTDEMDAGQRARNVVSGCAGGMHCLGCLPQPAENGTSGQERSDKRKRLHHWFSWQSSSQRVKIRGHIARLLIGKTQVRHRCFRLHGLWRTDPADQILRACSEVHRRSKSGGRRTSAEVQPSPCAPRTPGIVWQDPQFLSRSPVGRESDTAGRRMRYARSVLPADGSSRAAMASAKAQSDESQRASDAYVS